MSPCLVLRARQGSAAEPSCYTAFLGGMVSLTLRAAAIALLAGAAIPFAAVGAAVSSADSADHAEPAAGDQPGDIVVIGNRLYPDIAPERSLGEDAIAAYGLGTVEDLIDELRAELGEEEGDSIILVNGERVDHIDDIAGYPVEALRGVQILPRGSATRAGGTTGQRVYSLTLRRQMRQATATIAPRWSTEGAWSSVRAETALTRIKGPSRFNLSLRARDEGRLLESDRGIIQPGPRLPFALDGNAIAYPPPGEIDSMLSGLAGETVTVAAVPSAANPTLADFAVGANRPAETDLAAFRTLRPDVRSYDLSASYADRLAPWLTATGSLRFNMSRSRSLRGLPEGLFLLDPDHPLSPFGQPVQLAFYTSSPLASVFERDSVDGNATFNATRGKWRASLNLRHSESENRSRSERSASGIVTLTDGENPFGGDIADFVSVGNDRYSTRTGTSTAQLTISGSPLTLPAGPITTTVEGRLARSRLRGESSFAGIEDSRRSSRSERSARGLVEVPIASARNGFLPGLGEVSASAEVGWVDYTAAGTLRRHALGLSWEPRQFLRLRASTDETRRPPALEALNDPTQTTPGVRTLDLLTGQTVDVVQISGGNLALLPETVRTDRLSALFRLVPRFNLQLSGEYTATASRNQLSSLPPASIALMEAFPDRFVRDENGVLTLIDVRPVNFAGREQKLLRYGISLNAPIGAARTRIVPASAASEGQADDNPEGSDALALPAIQGPRPRIQLSLNHSLVLEDEILIRDSLDPIDLLDGGAIGIAGGRTRHQVDALAGISAGGLGARFNLTWRGPSELETRIGGNRDRLDFDPLLLVNLRAFAEGGRLAPGWSWAKGARLSLNALNLFDRRQGVRDSAGNTPLQYQPGYRDPLGRTIEIELRKTF